MGNKHESQIKKMGFKFRICACITDYKICNRLHPNQLHSWATNSGNSITHFVIDYASRGEALGSMSSPLVGNQLGL